MFESSASFNYFEKLSHYFKTPLVKFIYNQVWFAKISSKIRYHAYISQFCVDFPCFVFIVVHVRHALQLLSSYGAEALWRFFNSFRSCNICTGNCGHHMDNYAYAREVQKGGYEEIAWFWFIVGFKRSISFNLSFNNRIWNCSGQNFEVFSMIFGMLSSSLQLSCLYSE